MKFDLESLRERFSVADALDLFGVKHTKGRGPCPLCITSEHSDAFTHNGPVWYCHACGEKGTVFHLYARLAGVSVGRAIAEVASHLGETPTKPSDLEAKRRAREDAREFFHLREHQQALRWRLRTARISNLRAFARTFKRPGPIVSDILQTIYEEIGRLEVWVESQEYPAKGWIE